MGRGARQAHQRRAGFSPACCSTWCTACTWASAGRRRTWPCSWAVNQNGQGHHPVERSWPSRARGRRRSLAKLMKAEKRDYTFAQTFPTGTHADVAVLLAGRASASTRLQDAARHHRAAAADGWPTAARGQHGRLLRGRALECARPSSTRSGSTAATTQQIWNDHPEKVLGTTAEFVSRSLRTPRAPSPPPCWRRGQVDRRLASPTPHKTAETIAAQELRQHRRGRDRRTAHSRPLQRRPGQELGRLATHMQLLRTTARPTSPTCREAHVWFLTQHKRWGLLKSHPDYSAVAGRSTASTSTSRPRRRRQCPCRRAKCAPSALIDGVGLGRPGPRNYADGFKVQGLQRPAGLSPPFAVVPSCPSPACRGVRPRGRAHPLMNASRIRAAPRALWRVGALARLRRVPAGGWQSVALQGSTPFLLRADLEGGGGAVFRAFYRQRAQRQGRRLERAGVAHARGPGLRPGRAGRHPGRLRRWAASRSVLAHVLARRSACCVRCRRWPGCRWACCCFKAADPAAIWTIFICSIWPMVINTAAGRGARAAGLPQRGAGAQPVRVEGHHQACSCRRAALCADRGASGRRHRLAGHRGRRDAHRRRRHRLLAVGRVEQPQRRSTSSSPSS